MSRECYSLREVQVGTWGGLVFINPDPKAPPLATHLGSLPRHFEHSPLDKRYTLWHVQKTIKANWKVGLEAFLEAYHLVQTHPQALPSTGEHATEYDVWDEGLATFSRLITPQAVPSKHNRKPSAKEAIAVSWALLAGLRADQAAALPDDINDRASLAAWRRKTLGELTKADYSACSDVEMLDSIQYWLFPNFCPWYGEGLPLTYQFRPSGDSADECFMDVWMLIRQPDTGPRPAAPAMLKLAHDQPFQSLPELGAMGEIFDQDDCNMPQVQLGLKTWPGDPDGCTLARYQESRVRFLHQVLSRVLAQP
ncbi:SRPBCC family protein [Piscinibacter sp.]|uniref:SRPBCC family protein n=1 Tax=Piscinibacter sp. TaxID=1903157 RepID=UPI0039E6E81A